MGDDMMNKNNIKLLERYLLICATSKGLTEESVKAFRGDLNLFLRFIDGKDIDTLSHVDIEDFLAYCQIDRKNLNQTLARKQTSLNSFFKTMIKKDYLNMKNPLDKIDKIKYDSPIKDYLTATEMDRVFTYLESQEDARGLALFSLFYSSACRISEVYQQNKDSLDFESRKFLVMGKGRKPRECFFSEYAKEKLLKYLEAREDKLKPLFISRESNRWSKRAMQCYVKKVMSELQVTKNITPHSLRHSILTNLRLENVAIEDLQLLAGHKQISTTQSIYTHVGLSDVRNKFDDFHNKTKG